MEQAELVALLQRDFPDVQSTIAQMTQQEALVCADLLMSRRGHNSRDRKFLVAVWRQDRLAWRDARDAARDKKEQETE